MREKSERERENGRPVDGFGPLFSHKIVHHADAILLQILSHILTDLLHPFQLLLVFPVCD